MLLEFSAAWCGPCQSMTPIVRRLESAGFPVRKIDVDRDPDTAMRFRVTGLPTFVMFAGGQEVDRVVGAASFDRLRQMFEHSGAQAGDPGAARGQSPDAALSGQSSPDTGGSVVPHSGSADSGQHGDDANSGDVRFTSRHAMAATVRIKVDDPSGQAYGTGTVIDTHGLEALVVTCGHIFRDSGGKGPISVEAFDGSPPRKGHLISYDLQRDIGLVSFEPVRPIAPVSVAAEGSQIVRGNTVLSIGCDHGREPSVQRSRITAVDKYSGHPNIEVAGQPVEGRSGGGLFTANGMLIGICNFADPADNEGIYASLATIHWELDRIGQRRIYQPQQPTQDSLIAQGGLQSAASSREMTSMAVPAMPVQMPQQVAVMPAGEARSGAVSSGDLEVICIVRSRSNPRANSQVFVLDQPSAALMNQLSQMAPSTPASLVSAEARVRAAGPSELEPVIRAQSADR
jgi:thiol-disulfide isomerase/thioredoxin